MKPSHSYLSYLLRMWRSGESEQAIWRASLEDPMTGERQGFHTLPDLFAFLERMSRSGNEQAPTDNRQAELEEGGEQV
ncbi:MAG: hypothetical protein JW934_23420 [Anaerolineae bacterium]|nr:hypothetical protein [Anaerolineae bacterium]